ncbi:DUF3180 domain-containing protein [Corynebacterium freiburgense]|uniref:DUF3180 domain-containing protein n=1 Tax=Corynebacterium freiburgense TaxID=556548 RepID=UPI00041DCFF2|nr:DUF3180 domain-containing protein [Corynebacterium freiburgense]WJZ03686.1 hypothetical protein CFREI_12145 [Corynebacterium freiburgense]
MTQTRVSHLFVAGFFTAAIAGILSWRFYDELFAIPVTVSLTLWLMTLLCVVLALKIKGHIEGGTIGFDSTQLDPLRAAMWFAIGRASAWTGALVGGAYLGLASYVVPNAGELVAASEDLAGVLASLLGGISLSAAGVYLERACTLPPPTDAESIG